VSEIGWSDLLASLQPNGSTLDYAAQNPYQGPNGDRRFGIQKMFWQDGLVIGGQLLGWFAPTSGPGFPDPSANFVGWTTANDSGGPYDGTAVAQEQMAGNGAHSPVSNDGSVTPAPLFISNGWNDDLDPVDEGVRLYNRIRDLHPDAPVTLFDLNYGHPPRAGVPREGDIGRLFTAEGAWLQKYLGVSTAYPAVTDPVGGATAVTSACGANDTPIDGTVFHASTWAGLSPGEIRVDAAATQTIAPGTAPASPYEIEAVTVCTTGSATNTTGAAVVTSPVAPSGGYTILGFPTVVADLGVRGANDQVIGRLYDVDPSTNTERLIGRSVYRPTGVGTTSRQVFQLSAQAWKVAAGHVVKLELLSADSPFVRTATGQQPVTVSNLQLRLPTADGPGAAGGLVQAPAPKPLPAGYRLARDVTATGGSGVELTPAATPTPTPT
ncbi:MAG: hypothetical protein AAGC46_13665, partial [Solirubrobacteraceae bacterium]